VNATPDTPANTLQDQVWQLVEQGQLKQAAAACQQLNQQYPDYAPGWHSASQLAQRLKNPAVALQAIGRAVALEPDNAAWLLQQGNCLMQLGRMREARPLATALAQRQLDTAWQCATLGLILSRLELQPQALRQYQRASELEPGQAQHYYNLATVQRFLGDFDASERSLDRAIALDPGEYEAYSLRSQLRRQSPERNHVTQLETLLEAGIDDPRGEVRILFALAKELEDMGEPARAFDYLQRGATLRRRLMRYSVAGDISTMETISSRYDAAMFDGHIRGFGSPEPIFILGMPRTGTTLVERIIGSHTGVHAAGELNNFAMELTRLAGAPGMSKEELVARTREMDFAELGRRYVESTRPATGTTARFIDKMPLNFLYAGLIHLALPQARIINLQRHPLDTCYAIYKTQFQDAYPFSYDLQELGQYYVAYQQLMQHWQQVMPGVIHTVQYEQLVRDTETQSRALLSFCGLPWEDRCLRFYDNPDSSTTASASQVRMPVYASSVGRWRDYREQLRPLIDILQQAGIAIDD
jgi:tetratricopeptide (TPR) repeat protein